MVREFRTWEKKGEKQRRKRLGEVNITHLFQKFMLESVHLLTVCVVAVVCTYYIWRRLIFAVLKSARRWAYSWLGVWCCGGDKLQTVYIARVKTALTPCAPWLQRLVCRVADISMVGPVGTRLQVLYLGRALFTGSASTGQCNSAAVCLRLGYRPRSLWNQLSPSL